ncbi:hypothetical protein EDB83DRAFT_2528496 [Lactarius deliciosus]|nr:hypothetical protein EDB83DRAFT_2528496 [Lactarius deliciosus]
MCPHPATPIQPANPPSPPFSLQSSLATILAGVLTLAASNLARTRRSNEHELSQPVSVGAVRLYLCCEDMLGGPAVSVTMAEETQRDTGRGGGYGLAV